MSKREELIREYCRQVNESLHFIQKYMEGIVPAGRCSEELYWETKKISEELQKSNHEQTAGINKYIAYSWKVQRDIPGFVILSLQILRSKENAVRTCMYRGFVYDGTEQGNKALLLFPERIARRGERITAYNQTDGKRADNQ